MTPTILDRLIGWASPSAGLRRHFDRVRLARAYEAASPRDPWRPRRSGASANADHQADAASLRAKSRALIQNVAYITAGMNSRVGAVVGTGIAPTFSGGMDAKRAAKLWAKWVRVAGADTLPRNLYALQALVARTEDADGEVLIRKRWRRPSDGLPVPLQLQVLEVDWLDTSRARGDGGNQVINGIEYDPLGNAVAYWLFNTHPGDTSISKAQRLQSTRVPASEIIHVFAPQRPGQGRGFPRLASVIARARDLQLYEDAEAARKNTESRLGVVYSGDATGMAGADVDPQVAAKTGDLGELPSGSVFQLPAGGNLAVVQPTAVPGYTDYVKQQLHLICAGGGFTYEAATGDMREVNFSSARVRRLDYQREIEQHQWLHFVPDVCDEIVRAFLEAAEVANLIKSAASVEWEHSTPKWDYVDPSKEVKADLDEIFGGMGTWSEKIRRRGYDPKKVFDEWAADAAELRRRGLLDVMLALRNGAPLDGTPPAGEGNPPEPPA